MSLPIYQSDSQVLSMMQTNWSSILNPIIKMPTNNGNILTSVALINGVTVINHLLGRMMQGWFVTDINGAAAIYRSAPLNNLTLTLTSNAAVTVNIFVF